MLAAAEQALPADVAELLDEEWPSWVEAYSGDEMVVRVRDKELPHRADPRDAVRQQDPAGGAAALHRGRRAAAVPAPGEPARQVPVHRRGVRRSSARARTRPGCSPARATRSAPTAASSYLSADSDAKRLSTAFDSVTLYGRDPDTRPDIYGKVGTSGVSIATLDDMKVLYDGFDLSSPTTSVSMTINGPAPAILAYFLNTAIDQQVDAVRGRARARARRPTEHEELTAFALANVRGTVQADILKEDQGQNTCIFSTEFCAAHDGRHPGVVHPAPGAQLLLGLDLRLPHRRGRGEPDQPAGLHAGQRVHLRGELPGPRHGHRRLRAEPVVLLLQRDGRRVHGDRPGGPADLGGRDARALRRERARAEAQVPRADLGPVAARAGDELQRHPHHAAGAVRALRQRELVAHQRLRRGGHHARPRSRCAARWPSS